MAGIQDLIAAAAQAGIGGGGAPGGGGGMPMGAPQAGGGGDMASQLMGLVGKVASSPGGAQLMQQAIGALMGGGGAQGAQPPVGAQGNQPYPTTPNPSGQYPGEPDEGAAGPMPGQQNMGAYLNANKPMPQGMSTEDELAQAQKAMGASQVIDRRATSKTDEPTPEDIATLEQYPTDGNIANFDAKYGKGAAAFIMSDGKENGSKSIDDGDGKDSEGQGDSDYK